MELEEYRDKVCRDCDTFPVCQGSNIEDCKRRDEETDAANEAEQGTIHNFDSLYL